MHSSHRNDIAATLADYTGESLIVPLMREHEPVGVIQELSRLLQPVLEVTDMLPFYNAALNREFLESTATGFGVAFPHARISGSNRLCFALGRSAEPFSWGGRGTPMVQLVFLLAIPAANPSNYLQVLAALAKIGERNPGFRNLLEARDAVEMRAILGTMPVGALLKSQGPSLRKAGS